jgi:hypothetical protein
MQLHLIPLTVKKPKRDAGAKHVRAGKFRHPRRASGPIYVDDGFFQPVYVDDGIFRHPHVVLLCLSCLAFVTVYSACLRKLT